MTKLLKTGRMFSSVIGIFAISVIFKGSHFAMAQFPNFYQSPGGQSVPSLFPILGATDNKNNPSQGNSGWPFFGGMAPQQANPLRQDQQQQSPFGNPFFGGFPGFANPWYNPQQQQRQPSYQPQQQSPSYQPQQQSPSYQPQQPSYQSQQPAPYQNPSYQQPSREQPSYVNPPSSYPTAAQPPVPPPTYQNPNPPAQQQASYPTNSQWNPQPPPAAPPSAPVPAAGGQSPPKLDDGQYRPEPYQPAPPNNQYGQNQPTLNVNGEPYGQQQETPVEGENLVGDLRNNAPKDVGSSQPLLPAVGQAPGQGWVYPDDA